MALYLCLLFGSRWCFLLQKNTCFHVVSPVSVNHLIITNWLFDMWPLFNRARFSVIMCLNTLLTHHKICLGFQARALKNAVENWIVSIKFEIIIIFPALTPKRTHAGFNDIVALNYASQFIKIAYFYIPSSLSLCCRPVFVKESITQFMRSRVTT